MDRTINWVDAMVFAGYFGAVVWIGFRAWLRKGSEDFLIASRNLGPFASAVSLCASKTGAGAFMTHTAYVYLYGTAAMWGFVGATAGYIAFYFFADRLKELADQGKYYTLPDYFFDRFGTGPGYASGLSLVIIYVLGLTGQCVGGAKILALITGASYGVGLTVMIVLIVGYILIGGFAAVVRTDILQYLAIFILTVILAAALMNGSAAGSWKHIDVTLKPSISFALFFGAAMVPFAAGDVWQRVYATRGRLEARRSLLYAIVMYVTFGALLTSLGLLVKTMLPNSDPDVALIRAFGLYLPSGLIGAAGVVVYAALMSTADTNLYTAASVLVQDLLGLTRRGQSPKTVVRCIRAATVLIGSVAFVVALLIPELVRLGFLYLAMYTSVGVVVLLSIFDPRLSPPALACGLAAGASAVLGGFLMVSSAWLIWLGAGASIGVTLLVETLGGRRQTVRPARRETTP